VEPKNNARILCGRDNFAVTDLERVGGTIQPPFEDGPAVKEIWKGKRIFEPDTPQNEVETVYFSRCYSRDNEVDKMLHGEVHITDKDVIGYEFWLMPKEKILFGYDPPSSIIQKAPPVRPAGRGRSIRI
jgi:hypothetical protein